MCCIIPSSLGNTDIVLADIKRNFCRRYREGSPQESLPSTCLLAPLPGRIFNINQLSNQKSHLLAIYLIFHFPIIFFSPTSQIFTVLFALFFVCRFLVRSVFVCNLVCYVFLCCHVSSICLHLRLLNIYFYGSSSTCQSF